MKKAALPLLFAFLLPLFSCSGLKNYMLTEQDAAAAIRQMLQLGTQGGFQGAFGKDAVMAAIFPESIRKTLNTLEALGLSSEIDRFTKTMGAAAEQTATRSVPVFVNGINRMSLTDAIRVVKGGGTSATDYLRSSVGGELRESVNPVMKAALDEYKLTEQWDKIMKPARSLVGDKLNIDITKVMTLLVTEKMFQKLEETERQVRTNATARTTPLLQKVFSRDWSQG